MSKVCEAKSKRLQQETTYKLGGNFKGGFLYICYKCAEQNGFHHEIVSNIKTKHGDKPCQLC